MMILEHQNRTLTGEWTPSKDPRFPSFCDQDGQEVPLPHLGESRLEVLRDDSVDDEGWAYGLVFKKLSQSRPGGRSRALPLDRVRRRCWMPPDEAAARPCKAVSSRKPKLLLNAPRLDETDKEAFQMFIELLVTTLGKRTPSDLFSIVADPTVGFRLMRAHSTAYVEALEATCDPLEMDRRHNEDLLAGARAGAFACAAYGAPMHQGHLDSITAFIGGAAKHNVGRWTNSEHTTAFAKVADIQLEDVLMSSWGERTFEPAFCLAFARDKKWLVLSVRGTVEWRACLTDAAASSAEIAGGHTHDGMLRGARSILERTLSLIKAALAEHPDYELICTGHSLGAGTAVLVATLLRDGEMLEPGDPPALSRTTAYGFGVPPLFSHEVAERSAEYVVSFVRGFDFISRLSVFNVDRLLYELTQSSVASQAKDWVMKAFGREDVQHERFARTFGVEQPLAQVLLPPGRIVHLDTSVARRGGDARRAHPAYRANTSFYQRYFLGTSMFADHLPREYFVDVSLLLAATEASESQAGPLSEGHAEAPEDGGTTVAARAQCGVTPCAAAPEVVDARAIPTQGLGA